MKQLLRCEGTLEFWVSDTFEGDMLAPIIQNLLLKAEDGWDDYDEVFHCCHLVEIVRHDPSLHMQFHCLRRDGHTVGIGLITGGQVACPLFFPERLIPSEPQMELSVFNYFHIASGARGIGERWLREIILPYCTAQGYRAVYVKSSHPKVFSLYCRLGIEIGSYSSLSDNGLYSRDGKLFRIPLI